MLFCIYTYIYIWYDTCIYIYILCVWRGCRTLGHGRIFDWSSGGLICESKRKVTFPGVKHVSMHVYGYIRATRFFSRVIYTCCQQYVAKLSSTWQVQLLVSSHLWKISVQTLLVDVFCLLMLPFKMECIAILSWKPFSFNPGFEESDQQTLPRCVWSPCFRTKGNLGVGSRERQNS